MADGTAVDAANFIAGRWLAPAGGTYERKSPAAPTRSLGSFPLSSAHDVSQAVSAAADALPAWSALPILRRAETLTAVATELRARADELGRVISQETGKPLREAVPEVHRAVAVLTYFAAETYRPTGEHFEQANGALTFTTRRPKGVVAVITPWNFPVAIPMWKIAPALVYGNTVVWKYSEESPWVSRLVLECFARAGLPAGVLNGIGGTARSMGDSLITAGEVAAISFTGSVEVGRTIRTGAADRPVQMELGGQNALLVAADADLDRAVDAAYAGAYWCAGQKCTSTRRIYVHSHIYDSFRARLTERIERGVVGDPMQTTTEVGPLVNKVQLDRVRQAVARGQTEGGQLVTKDTAFAEGWFHSPTLFEDVDDSAYLSREEVFGPVASLYRFEELDEAVTRANAVQYGLSMALFTRHLGHVDHFLRHAQAGVLHINSATPGTEVHVPFGGLKNSGSGPKEQGQAAREFYTDSVTVYQDV